MYPFLETIYKSFKVFSKITSHKNDAIIFKKMKMALCLNSNCFLELSLEFPVLGPRHDQVVYGSGGRERGREAVVERGKQDVYVVHVNLVAVERQNAAAIVVRR